MHQEIPKVVPLLRGYPGYNELTSFGNLKSRVWYVWVPNRNYCIKRTLLS